ncbi:MAG TPA: tetratricopeptide repeat protein [Actinomycetes bacterium]|nr:tetratricopeptide repeat protein [Actinomycetes bacterium]
MRDCREEAFALFGLGETQRARGLPQEAVDCYRRCLPAFRDFGEREWEARAMVALGLALETGGEQVEALALWRDALPVLDALGMPEAAEVQARLRSRDGPGPGRDGP